MMRRNQFWRMSKRLAIRSPPLRSSARFHRHDGPGKVRAGQPVPEAFPMEFLSQDLLPSSIEAHDMERALGQVDTNGDKCRFRGDLRLLGGLLVASRVVRFYSK